MMQCVKKELLYVLPAVEGTQFNASFYGMVDQITETVNAFFGTDSSFFPSTGSCEWHFSV
jgi:hypothetical protein